MAKALADFIASTQNFELGKDGAPPRKFPILSFGKTETVNGNYEFTREDGERILSDWKARGTKLASDYEHAAYHASSKGGEAPASSWFDLELGDDGLYASNVEWTPRADGMLRSREYRYFSPWVTLREDGRVGGFKNFGLTNRPATIGMKALVASELPQSNPPAPQEQPPMKTLLKTLLLAEDATEAQAVSKAASMLQERDAIFTATGTKDLGSAMAAIENFKRDAETGRAAVAQLVELKKASAKSLKDFVCASEAFGKKVSPNQKDFWMSQEVETIQAFLAQAPDLQPVSGAPVPGQKNPATESVLKLSADDEATAAKCGISPEDFLKSKADLVKNGVLA